MRISSALLSALTVALLLGVGPSDGFDGNSPSNQVSALEAFRSGTQALKVGETDKAVTSLQYAAENGYALAQWKLGRMYADGDGVAETRNVLLEHGLFEALAERPEAVMAELHRAMVAARGDPDLLFALAELSFLHGQAVSKPAYRLAAAIYASAFLFPEGLGSERSG